MTRQISAKEQSEALRPLTLTERMAYIGTNHPDLVFTTAFGTEDQLLTWAIVNGGNPMTIATHLTGKLLEHVHSVRSITEERYDIRIDGIRSGSGPVWISGRCQHVLNANRDAPLAKWHSDKSMLEINPLADWTFEEVLEAVAAHEVPINPLFAHEISSITHDDVAPLDDPLITLPLI